MSDDATLLQRYAREASEEAFAELVRRYLPLVYAAALRRTAGDAHRAADVSQLVFVSLARHAGELAHHTVLAGWLHTATRNAALNLLRTETRRRAREQEAHTMMHDLSSGAETDWPRLRPVLDTALDELDPRDREAVLVRFFPSRPFAEVAATLQVSEEAARKRVDRALEKLRERLARAGITSTAAALGVALAGQPLVAVPAGLAASAVSAALAGAASATLTSSGAGMIFMGTKLKIAVVGALLAVGAGTWWTRQHRLDEELAAAADRNARQATQLAELRRENARLAEVERRAVEQAKAAESATASAVGPERRALEDLQLLADLQRKGVMRTGLSVIEVEGRIQPKWAKLFSLTPAEQTRLTEAIAAARQQMGAKELAYATVKREEAGKLVITVAPFAEGAEIYDRLMETCAQVLGPERYPAFSTLGLKALEDSLRGLGVMKQTLTVTHDPAPTDPKREWTLTIWANRPDGTVTQGGASDSQLERVVGFLLGPLVQLVPPDL